MTIAQA